MIRVLVVDDHEIVREGLKSIISQAGDIAVTAEASDGSGALETVSKNEFDVAMLDISLPDMNGLDVLAGIKKQKPDLPVLMLSIHPEERYAVRALRAGASGYMTKESARGELIEAIREASSGRKYVTSSLAQRLASELGIDYEKPVLETLSDREYEVLRSIAKGKTIKQIADHMFLSPSTVSTYRLRLLSKLGFTTNAELTRYAIEHKLID